MSLLLVAMLQVATASPPERVDLTIAQPCAARAGAADEVVVCANRDGRSPYRLEEPVVATKAPPKAEVAIAEGVSAATETEAADVGGFPSERAMIRLKVRF